MLLSCPNCESKFNLGNIQVHHVRCPVCYSTWQVDKINSIDPYLEKRQTSEKTVDKTNGLNLFKNINNALCVFLIAAVLFFSLLHYQKYNYRQNQIKIKEIRALPTEEKLHLRCQIHNIGDKKTSVHAMKIQISDFNYQNNSRIWTSITLEPYSSMYFSTTIILPQNLPSSYETSMILE